MTIEQGLVAELRADGAVSAIVGQRIFPEVVPQGQDGAAIVYRRVGTTRHQTLDGQRNVIEVIMRIDCWEDSFGACWTLANAVRSALNQLTGAIGGFTIQRSHLEAESNLSVFEGDKREYRVSQDYVIWYVEV